MCSGVAPVGGIWSFSEVYPQEIRIGNLILTDTTSLSERLPSKAIIPAVLKPTTATLYICTLHSPRRAKTFLISSFVSARSR